MFELEAPYYLSIGMSYEQYWYGDPLMIHAYREADVQRQKRVNAESWLAGVYVYDAVSCALANAFRKKGTEPARFPAKPYALGEPERREKTAQEEERETIRANIYMRQMERAGRAWGKA